MVELNSTAKIQKKSAVCKFFVLKFSVFQNFFCDLNLVLDVRSHVTSMLPLCYLYVRSCVRSFSTGNGSVHTCACIFATFDVRSLKKMRLSECRVKLACILLRRSILREANGKC